MGRHFPAREQTVKSSKIICFAKNDQIFSKKNIKKLWENGKNTGQVGFLSVRNSGNHYCFIWYYIWTFLYWTVVDAILEQSLYYFLPDMLNLS